MGNISNDPTGSIQNYQVGGGETTQTAKAQQMYGIITDTIESNLGAPSRVAYTQNTNHPALAPPLGNTNPTPFQYVSNPPTYEKQYYDAFTDVTEKLQMQNNWSEKTVDKFRFMHLTPSAPVDDPNLKGILKQAEADVATRLGVSDQGAPKEQIADFKREVEGQFNSAFDKALDEYALHNGLSDAEKAQIKFAQYNPSIAHASGEIKEILEGLNKTALGAIQEQFQSPSNWSPEVNNKAFNFSLGYTFSSNVEEAIDQQSGLTETEMKAMKFLLFHPDSEVVGKSKLQKILSGLEGAALGEMEGLPSGFKPTPSAWRMDTRLNGDVNYTFNQILAKQNLSADQLAKVKAAIIDEKSADPATQKLIENIRGQAIAEVRAANGLPSNWQPLSKTVTMSTATMMTNNVLKGADEYVGALRAQINAMPEGSDKTTYTNFLRIVSQAISKLKDSVFEMQGYDAKLAQTVSKEEMETQLGKLKEQADKMAEIKEKQKKMKALDKLGVFGKILKYLFMIIFAVLMAAVVGPLAFILLAAAIAVTIGDDVYAASHGGKGFMAEMFQKISKAMPNTPLGKMLSAFVQFIVVAAIGAATLNLPLMIDMLYEKSSINEDFCKACGLNEQQAGYFKMAFQMFAMVLEMIITTVLTGGAAAPAMVGKLMGSVAKAAGDVASLFAKLSQSLIQSSSKMAKYIGDLLEKLAEAMKTFMKTLQAQASIISKFNSPIAAQAKAAEKAAKQVVESIKKVMNAMQFTASIADSASQIPKHILGAQISFMRGDLDKYVVEVEALIKLLRKFINMLFQSLSNYGDWAKDLSHMQGKIYKDLSAVTSQIHNA